MPGQDDPSPASDVIAWVSLPARDEPWRKTLFLLAIIAVMAVLASFQGGLFLGALALLLVLILMGPYFLPCRFEISDRGVKKWFPLFNRDRPWSVYKRYVPQKDGVFLSTFAAPSRLDSFRGDFIRFSAGTDRQRVMDLVRKHLGAK